MQFGTYDTISICIAKPTLPMCTYIFNMIDYSYAIIFMPMREKQNAISRKLHAELIKLATEDETIQYVLLGICIGLVLLGTAMITPIFITVIRDKSHVFKIFAFIEKNEIEKIVVDCKKMDLKNLRFKKRWLEGSQGDAERFWRKMIAENSIKGFKEVEKEEKPSENFSHFFHQSLHKDASIDIDELEKKKSEQKVEDDCMFTQQKSEIEDKKQKRVEMLSEIE